MKIVPHEDIFAINEGGVSGQSVIELHRLKHEHRKIIEFDISQHLLLIERVKGPSYATMILGLANGTWLIHEGRGEVRKRLIEGQVVKVIERRET